MTHEYAVAMASRWIQMAKVLNPNCPEDEAALGIEIASTLHKLASGLEAMSDETDHMATCALVDSHGACNCAVKEARKILHDLAAQADEGNESSVSFGEEFVKALFEHEQD